MTIEKQQPVPEKQRSVPEEPFFGEGYFRERNKNRKSKNQKNRERLRELRGDSPSPEHSSETTHAKR